MHQTTVRFGPDLWQDIEVEAERAGVSVAQYVRDSAMMRVAYTRGREGDPHYDAALRVVSEGGTTQESKEWPTGTRSESQRADSRQARRQARALRDQAEQRATSEDSEQADSRLDG
jgi:hypothetical protein